jgi:hypothetical protein
MPCQRWRDQEKSQWALCYKSKRRCPGYTLINLAVIWFLGYGYDMNSFIKGMGSFNLFPNPKLTRTKSENAWNGVSNAFARTGMNMQKAIIELNAQLKSPPPDAAYGKQGR